MKILLILSDGPLDVRQFGLDNELTILGLIEAVKMAFTLLLEIFDLLDQLHPILSNVGQPSGELKKEQGGHIISNSKES